MLLEINKLILMAKEAKLEFHEMEHTLTDTHTHTKIGNYYKG